MKLRIKPCDPMTTDAYKIEGYSVTVRDENGVVWESETPADYKSGADIDPEVPEVGDYEIHVSTISTRPGAFPSLPWVVKVSNGQITHQEPGSRHSLTPIILPAVAGVTIEGHSPEPEAVVKRGPGRPRKIVQTQTAQTAPQST